jgi:hypothetical protein
MPVHVVIANYGTVTLPDSATPADIAAVVAKFPSVPVRVTRTPDAEGK